MAVYSPAEDSLFFQSFLDTFLSKKKKKKISYLDMGTGSGILSEAAAKHIPAENILAADINQEAIKIVRKKGFSVIRSNLFDKINKNFDIITFNAPYLPKDPREPKDSQLATTGGKRGDEISLKFLKQAKKHLNKNGKIFLLISTLTPLDKIKKYGYRIVTKKKMFMEQLLILEFSND
jgi:release factor glutamine methyltransferase